MSSRAAHPVTGSASDAEIVQADLTWTGTRFEPDIQVRVSADGRIAAVGRLGERPTQHLAGRALLPGFVNAHSHAFQRGLRGRGERFPAGAGSFWTWREAMYALVESLDERSLYALSRQAFAEMLDAGITTVGEFHYVHHTRGTRDFALDTAVLRAAADAGIRIVLLEAYYVTGGIGQPLAGAQLRFDGASPDAYWRQMDRLAAQCDPKTQSLGAVVHSVRAARPDELASIAREATRRGLVFHIHVEEQRREIDDTIAAYGRRPLQLLIEAMMPDRADAPNPAESPNPLPAAPRAGWVTGVHCTHSEATDLARFVAAGGGVCICPLTEANLGDGLPRWLGAMHAGDMCGTAGPGIAGRLSLGTDSNARISMLEEMRWLEYGQRLAAEQRGALRDAAGGVAPALLNIATAGGAQSLGLPAGRIAPGCWADFAVIDLSHPSLAGVETDALAAALVFGCDNEVIAETWIGGRRRTRS